MKKIVFLVCSVLFCTYMHGWVDMDSSIEHIRKVEHDELNAWRMRVGAGLIIGFCSHLFFKNKVAANVIGVPTAATALWLYRRKISTHVEPEVCGFEMANAYVIGAFAGIFVRRGVCSIVDAFKRTFCKSSARVHITNEHENGQKQDETM